ncbi:MAG: cyclic nucleotide-binding domain (cNMP-BD) protein [Gammaproteobacteria bacterium]|nr:cyclic nucleotide-binding domain (cNMP-BD) protein [Gammaproteobacteria bacterium]
MDAMCPTRQWPRALLPTLSGVAVENKLIESLPRSERGRLLAICERIELVRGEMLGECGGPTRYVYFPTDGFISLVTPLDGKPVLEVGMVGREGMWGAHLALGVMTEPLHALVQGSGASWRVGARAFRDELARSAALRRSIHRYIYVLMTQLASSAACLRFHRLGPRLARWLLMSQDRAHSDSFYVTHQFLSYMLGVRRVGVTAAAGELQRDGLIEYSRGDITVLNRAGLEAASCSCYAADTQAYSLLSN